MRILALLTGIFLLFAYGCAEEEGTSERTDIAGAAEADTIFVTAVDTIGSEMGETPDVFAFIVDAAWTSQGNIAVLDAQRIVLQLFDADGSELLQIGAKGPGPGEYQLPLGLAVVDDGYFVSDIAGAKILEYDSAGEYAAEMTGFFPMPPSRISGTPDGRFLASHVFMDMEGEDGPTASLDFVAYSDSTAPQTVFQQYPIDMSGGRIEASMNMAFCSGPGGEAYMAEMSDSLFFVAGFDRAGNEILRISEEFDRVPLSEAELAEERLSISLSMVNGETTLATERLPNSDTYRNIIEDIGVDAQGRIWVQMGNADTTWFRVYSSAGELVSIAVPDSTLPDNADYSISPDGMLAYDSDPEDWPKVYLLEMR